MRHRQGALVALVEGSTRAPHEGVSRAVLLIAASDHAVKPPAVDRAVQHESMYRRTHLCAKAARQSGVRALASEEWDASGLSAPAAGPCESAAVAF